MPHASAAQAALPFGDQPDASLGWDRILLAAFARSDRQQGFLSEAEEAVRASPGDPHILLLAATAALLTDGRGRGVSPSPPAWVTAPEPSEKGPGQMPGVGTAETGARTFLASMNR